MTMDSTRPQPKEKHARHVILIAGPSGCGKTHLIRKLSRPPHDQFILKVLKQLDCDPNQRLKRSTLERMQRLMDPANAKKRKTRKLDYCLLLHIDLTSINHRSNLKLLRQILTRTTRLDAITLYAPPHEWRERVINRIHTENEPSMRAGVIALSAKLSHKISTFLYHREYKKWCKESNSLNINKSTIINTFTQTIYSSTKPPF
tara:strand:- start:1318 stop:1926 length:609 start_codon:yes stop_codon:yes gene_type:complete